MSTIPEKAAETVTPARKPAVPAEKVKPKGYSNPALQAMGIPRLRLPSRNWSIFWAVLGLTTGGIVYDKYEQKQLRKRWMSYVQPQSEAEVAPNVKPRRLTIFIAPPPNDFLTESLRYFKRYVKPVLNAGGLDFEIFTSERQGDIRVHVADQIRDLRRNATAFKQVELVKQKNEAYKRSWGYWFSKFNVFKKKEVVDPNATKSVKQCYTPADVFGINYKTKPMAVEYEDAQFENPHDAGGIICVGRGVYKEYMRGVHEGLLGPLEQPKVEIVEAVEQVVVEAETSAAIPTLDTTLAPATDEASKSDFRYNGDVDDLPNANLKSKPPVKAPYISAEDYATATLAPEFNFSTTIRDHNNVPVFFELPIFVLRIPNILGFLNSPQRIYRFYTKRWIADEFNKGAVAVALNAKRPFTPADADLALVEETDWPKKWVASGKEKASEWTRDFKVDHRVTSRMFVYDATLLELGEKKDQT
ncbi:hypothetical protein BABINDRAFT_162303 [Babjeviella inositovora NRRL Y-12698]|uniref:Mitochondrial import inner membrane translocase subunit TIM54 n=1 Tax=Babjeviella inositovora NRRL Y-12698 TaxID=984486 RepID=A0A1E3QNI5_9ASCO|nr:uncharacterized protein BABINDRAFT_162303 [Babjeviella inositovora NRRL Y-12698]ODQ79269.1 hypothetical protein BABINDRAFT_162303 [Babjeviella inositovora NRRL Y-12698]